MITKEQFYEQVQANKARLRTLVLVGSANDKADFVNQTAILEYCSAAERPLFLAMQFRTTLVKAYLMSMLKQPLYKSVLYAVPFNLAANPQSFINAMHVQKTRLLADATGEARQDLYNATRDKMFHEFINSPSLSPNGNDSNSDSNSLSDDGGTAQSPYSPVTVAPILSMLGLPFWLVKFTRTPKGEGRKWTGELPKAPDNLNMNLFVVADDFGVQPPTNNPNLATKPYKRDGKEVVLTDELLEEL